MYRAYSWMCVARKLRAVMRNHMDSQFCYRSDADVLRNPTGVSALLWKKKRELQPSPPTVRPTLGRLGPVAGTDTDLDRLAADGQ